MTISKKYFEQQISKLFDKEIKKMLSEEELDNFKKIKKSLFTVKSFYKSSFESNLDETLIEANIKNTKNLQTQLGYKGAVISILYKNNKAILIDGRWDKIEETVLHTKNGPYIGVWKDGSGGFINESGKIKVSITYSNISEAILNPLSDKLLWLQRNNKEYGYGVVTIGGRNQTNFSHIKENVELFKVVTKEYVKLQNKNGENIFDLANKKYLFDEGKFSQISISEHGNSFICRKHNEKYCIVTEHNMKEDNIIEFDSINSLGANTYQAMNDKKIGIIDSTGKTIVEFAYDRILFVGNDVISLKKKNIIETFSFDGNIIGENNG